MSDQRNNGRFNPGQSGNPEGARKRKTPEQKLLEAIERDAPALVERGLIVGMTDNAVLASALNYLAECLRYKNIQATAELQALNYTAAGGVH
ncbi:DUF5681 domain-containing protein [Aeromonas salmonicida]|uniref:DUF5681 domain-containing protein n=1 Tax=Aeromonas salmonicida TaxID=645 RepID=UPI0021170359|nr:DUF5681 domain-containing protein [Aeromonas salmonicida]UUI59686.1 DUF5681 domain-containing protein [Aeromonas salmonicida]